MVGREGPKGGVRANDPFPRQLHALKQLSETAPGKEAAPLSAPQSLPCPPRTWVQAKGPEWAAASPPRPREPEAGNPTCRPRPRGRPLPGRELAPGCGRSSPLRQLPRPRDRGRAGQVRVARAPPARALRPQLTWPPGAGGVRMPGLVAGRCAAEERAAGGRGSRGAGRDVAVARREQERPPLRRGRSLGSAPAEDASPAPTRAGCRETRVGRRVLCIKAAVTSRGARDLRSKGRGLGGGGA